MRHATGGFLSRTAVLAALLAVSAANAGASTARFAGMGVSGDYVAARAAQRLTLAVDAREAPRHILHVRETVPVTAATMSLSYPEWIPGEHAPTGPIAEVAGLFAKVDGTVRPWRRDPADPFTIRVAVPAGAKSLELDFDFLLTSSTDGYSSASSASGKLLLLSWNQVVFAPTHVPTDAVSIEASLTLPEGWRHGTALAAAGESGGTLKFAPVSLSTLVDSPVLAGRYFRRVDLTPGTTPGYFLDMAADGEAALAIPDSMVAAHGRMVREAEAFFGGSHHGEYHFLLTMSDHTSHFGLEHHASSDDRVAERYWLDDEQRLSDVTLLSHELAHSWNGKYRRPAGLATSDFSTPMKGELLWVYEGLTQYSGWVLAARGGTSTTPQALELLASTAAGMESQRGRDWRPLVDTAIDAQHLYSARSAWGDWRRGVDFYDEGLLLWLDADVTIRRLTHDAKSLDDFCHAFHGGHGPAKVVPYTLADVVAALNAVVPNDWAGFLRERVEAVQPHAPLAGVTAGGWAIAWTDTMPEMLKASEGANKNLDERWSIGVVVNAENGVLVDVVPGSAAERAGFAPDMKLIGVNGRRFDEHVLRDAIRASAQGGPLELLAENDDYFHQAPLDWHGGLRYPVLVRDPAAPDRISAILAPHAGN